MHYSRIQSLTLDVLSTSELLVSGSLIPGVWHLPGIVLGSGAPKPPGCGFQPSSLLVSYQLASVSPQLQISAPSMVL